MSTKQWLMIGGGAIAAYLLYQWYTASASASTTSPAVPAPTSGGGDNSTSAASASASGASDQLALPSPDTSTAGGPLPMVDPMFGPGGSTIMRVAPPSTGGPHPPVFGSWFAHLPPGRKAAVAKMSWAQKQAAYRAFVNAWHNRYASAA